MMTKLTLFIAITLLLCASHYLAAVLGFAVADKRADHAKWNTRVAWICGFAALPWAVAMLLIAVVAT